MRLEKDHDITLPIGAVIGGLVGFANQWLRGHEEYAFDPLSNRSAGI